MTVGIVGLGLIGGSFAKAYHEADHRVLAFDTDQSVFDFAILSGVVDGPLSEESLSSCDLILIAVYPSAAVEYLRQNGYEQYEISNFAKPGRESRHNLKYWKLQEYAGFGPGAHSDFGGVRYAYEKDLDAYIAAAHGGQFRFSENTVIPPRDRDVEWVMLGARLISGLDPKDYEAQFRRRFDPIFLPFLQKCVAAGYAVSENGVWHLTPKGFLVSNQIIGGLLDAQAAEKQRRADAAARGDFRVNLD